MRLSKVLASHRSPIEPFPPEEIRWQLEGEQSLGRTVQPQNAAVCADCHGTHEILMAGDPKSSTFKFNVPGTCGKCHAQEGQNYIQSVHGQAIGRGNWLAPVCTDCHGIHTIQAPDNPSSSVSAQALAQITCARCHQGLRLTSEFGVPGARVASYTPAITDWLRGSALRSWPTAPVAMDRI
ncbi:MAG: hypothetical protein WCA27_30920 [Candidatus Sulfotelmatobacter sp.]